MSRDDPTLGSVTSDAWIEFLTVLKWILSGVMAAVFIALWVSVQWLVDRHIVAKYGVELTGTSATVLVCSQWLVAIATLAPILEYVVKLVCTSTVRTVGFIKSEINKIL